MVYVGVGGFRSGESIRDEFSGLDKIYNFELKRDLKDYDIKFRKENDLLTTIDSEYLLKYLLNNTSRFKFDSVELHDKNYKIKCKKVDENGNNIEFTIDFLKVDEDTICVDFQKKSGIAIDYFNLVKEIKNLVETIQTV